METNYILRFVEIKREQGYFRTGDMLFAWYATPNLLCRLAARMLGFKWEPRE